MRLLALLLLLTPTAAQAHHASGGGASGVDYPGSALGVPTTAVSATVAATVLPSPAGDRTYVSSTVSGSVAFRHRLALEVAVPFLLGGQVGHSPEPAIGASTVGLRALVLPGGKARDPRVSLGASFALPGTFSTDQPAASTALRTWAAVTGHSAIVSGGGEVGAAAGFGEGASSLIAAAGFVGLTPSELIEIRVEGRLRVAFDGPLAERALSLAVDVAGSVTLRPLPRLNVGLVVGGSPVTGFAPLFQAGGVVAVDLGDQEPDEHPDDCSCELPVDDVPTM